MYTKPDLKNMAFGNLSFSQPTAYSHVAHPMQNLALAAATSNHFEILCHSTLQTALSLLQLRLPTTSLNQYERQAVKQLIETSFRQ
jgi:hypothetical protein